MCICVCAYRYIFVYVYRRVWVYLCACVCVWMHVCIHECVCVCMGVSMCIFMCVWVCMCSCVGHVIDMYVLARGQHQVLLSMCAFQDVSVNPKLTHWLGWLASELQGPCCLWSLVLW